jgi:hypothetical protein
MGRSHDKNPTGIRPQQYGDKTPVSLPMKKALIDEVNQKLVISGGKVRINGA